MTDERLRGIAVKAALTPSESHVWLAVERGGSLEVLIYHWGELPKRVWPRRKALERRRCIADKLLRDARRKVARAFPGWREAGLRAAADVLDCARNRTLGEDPAKLAAEAGVPEWLRFDGAPNPAVRAKMVTPEELMGGLQANGVRALGGG